MAFTKEELAAMAAADAEIEAEFYLTPEDLARSRAQDREAVLEQMDPERRKVAAQNKAWYAANKEKVAAQHKAWYAANKEKVAAQHKAYREANKDKCIAYMREYYRKKEGRSRCSAESEAADGAEV